jgi:hypothetical protein
VSGRTEREPRASTQARLEGPRASGRPKLVSECGGKIRRQDPLSSGEATGVPDQGEPVTRVVPRITNSSLLDARTFFIIPRKSKKEFDRHESQ